MSDVAQEMNKRREYDEEDIYDGSEGDHNWQDRVVEDGYNDGFPGCGRRAVD
jgi:hypothetical protein